ncbi:type IV pilus twitching motility protein PilT [Cellulomonas sp. ATA003]|uniref:type IV pilus twitching motility protein PilT n=1 Tax=Cellulomonas sp. ATA003 TaxID=3073064 RepID=UPI002872EF39|nr:type IV pilus twitching motility protein PilT [Cellulomonas sp. ATA003]WNB87376.1 type IV pilus twitching motility protein PilT [Cellulomonas sp. ATA003]
MSESYLVDEDPAGFPAPLWPAPSASPAVGVPAQGPARGMPPSDLTDLSTPGALGALGVLGAPPPGAPDHGSRVGLTGFRDRDLDLDTALRATIAAGASDLHLSAGAPPMLRVDGTLRPLEGHGPLSGTSLQRSVYAALTQRQRERFEAELELDFAYAVAGAARFRVNLYQQRSSVGAVFRLIPHEIKALEQLGVPAVVGNFAGLPRGLVLVTGPTGSGKSTTLAAIIDLANRTRHDHIVTVEDPIEFLHKHKSCLVNQREVGADTHSFTAALRHALRQDPDIILVGELRDLETISVALTAAETGHLVFATLHTQDAAQTVDRIIDVFPAEQHGQIRTQLAGALQGIVSQTLCRTASGRGRAVATEVMVATPAIRNLIREGKTHQLYSVMQAGGQYGMHTLDQDLAELVTSGRVTYEDGLEKCHHAEDFTRLTGRTGSGRTTGAPGAPWSTAPRTTRSARCRRPWRRGRR